MLNRPTVGAFRIARSRLVLLFVPVLSVALLACSAPSSISTEGTNGKGDSAYSTFEEVWQSGELSDTRFIWQGFHHEWQRAILAWQTPHRVSTLGAFIDSEHAVADDSGWAAAATANFSFGPGVDGDYAEPKLNYRAVHDDTLRMRSGKVEFRFTDQATEGSVPEATTVTVKTVRIPRTAGSTQAARRENYAVILNGFDLRTSCDDAIQPQGESCNSNGVWPHHFHLGVEDCEADEAEIRCAFTFVLGRSFNPDGMKPMNSRMDVALDLYFAVIEGDKEQFNKTAAIGKVARSTLQAGPVSGVATSSGKKGFPHAMTAVKSFGYELLASGKSDRRGRYLSTHSFSVSDRSYDPNSGEMSFDYLLGLSAPATVRQADTRYWLKSTLLQFGEGANLSALAVAQGSVCISGLGFNCEKKGLAETDTDATDIYVHHRSF